MDLDGLEKLVNTNHETVMVLLKSMDKKLDKGDKRFEGIDGKILSHDRSLTKIKTIGGVLSLIWAGMVWVGAALLK